MYNAHVKKAIQASIGKNPYPCGSRNHADEGCTLDPTRAFRVNLIGADERDSSTPIQSQSQASVAADSYTGCLILTLLGELLPLEFVVGWNYGRGTTQPI